MGQILKRFKNPLSSKWIWVVLGFFILGLTLYFSGYIGDESTRLSFSDGSIAMQTLAQVKREIEQSKSNGDYALKVGEDEVEWEEVEEVIALDMEIAMDLDSSLREITEGKGDYRNMIVNRIIRREVIEDLAINYGLDQDASKQEKKIAGTYFERQGSFSSSSEDERERRIRRLVLKRRLQGEESKYDLSIFYVLKVGDSAETMMEEGKDLDSIVERKTNELYGLYQSGASDQEMEEFMLNDPIVGVLNRGATIQKLTDQTIPDLGEVLPVTTEKILSLSVGESSSVYLLMVDIDASKKGFEEYAYGFVRLDGVSKGSLSDYGSELEETRENTKIISNLPWDIDE